MSASFLVPGQPLRQLILDLNSIHAEKNEHEKMFTTPLGCLAFIAGVRNEMSNEVTKREGRRLPSLIPNFMKRLFTLVGVWGVDRFLESLQSKYPSSGCGYCGKLPCACGSEKVTPWTRTNIELSPDQNHWSLGSWQSHHLLVYGQKDRTRSLKDCLESHSGEFFEALTVATWLEYAMRYGHPTEHAEQALSLELADMFMRTLSIANYLVVDIETLIQRRYASGCAKCHNLRCRCPSTIEDFHLFERETMAATRLAE